MSEIEVPEVSEEGFTVLHDVQNAAVDIVFVHGLQGSPYKTWTSSKIPPTKPKASKSSKKRRHKFGRLLGCFASGSDETLETDEDNERQGSPRFFRSQKPEIFWPRDLLGEEDWCKSSRILTYGYDSKITKGYTNVNKNDLFAHAKDLLYSLQREKPMRRPVIFVVHSLGGLILKETLRRSEASEEDEVKDIIKSTAGIIFLGTPHRGSPGFASLGEIVQRSVSMIARVDSNPTILRSLGIDSPELELSRESFLVLWRNYNFRVKTFQEAFGVSGAKIGPANEKVVPDTSSSLDDPQEHAETISANHMNMTKFSSSRDPGYRKVSFEIKTMLARCLQDPVITQDARDLLQSLYFPEMYNRQQNIQVAMDQTCDWLFTSTQYSNWIDRVGVADHCGLLWIKGKPGAGKSTLMKEAMRRTEAKYAGSKTSTSAFFFNARGTQHLEKTPMGLYQSLLHQVLQQDPVALSHLASAYKKKVQFQPTASWHQQELQNFLVQVFATSVSQPAIIFIDAMDECADDEVRELVSFFKQLTTQAFQAGARLNVCVSSRHYPHISIDGCPEVVVERNNRPDILLFIEAEAKYHHSIKELKQDISDRSAGVFLWVVLVISILKKSGRGKSIKWLREKLVDSPKELATLFKALFKETDQEEVAATISIMHLVLFARSPLNVREIHAAVAFSLRAYSSIDSWKESKEFLEDDATRHEMVLEISRGLLEPTPSSLPSNVVTQDEKTPTLPTQAAPTYQFIHETVREFFLSGEGFKLLRPDSAPVIGSGHETLALACARYLDCCVKASDNSDFLQYSTLWLFHHLENAEMGGQSQERVLRLMQSRGLLKKFVHLRPNRFDTTRSSIVSANATLMYAAAETGSIYIAKRLKAMSFSINEQCDASHRYPLLTAVSGTWMWATDKDSKATVSVKSEFIIKEPFKPMVTWLLENGAQVSDKTLSSHTALHFAAASNIDTLRAILAHNPDVNARDYYDNTPLHMAGRTYSAYTTEICTILLDHGADIGAINGKGNTPLLELYSTSALSSLEPCKILVEAGSPLELKNHEGNTILLEIANALEGTPGSYLLRNEDQLALRLYTYLVEAGANESVTGADGRAAKDIMRDFLTDRRREWDF